jgi:hypothetical protein
VIAPTDQSLARAHVEALRATLPLDGVPVRHSPSMRDLTQRSDADLDAIGQVVSHDDWMERHLLRLIPHLPIELQALARDDRLVLGETGGSEPDARELALPDGSFAIVISLAMSRLAYYTCKVVARALLAKDPASTAADGARDIAEVAWWYRLTGTAQRPSSETGPEITELAYWLSQATDGFLVAHEVGHVWLGVLGRDAAFRFLPEMPELEIAHREELLSDGIAIDLLMRSARADGADDRGLANTQVGAEISLILLALLEGLGFSVGRQHPAAERRIAYVRSVSGLASKEVDLMRQVIEPLRSEIRSILSGAKP